MLRERIKGLEHKIIEMIRNGSRNNLGIYDRMHQWTVQLLLVADTAALPQAAGRPEGALPDPAGGAARLGRGRSQCGAARGAAGQRRPEEPRASSLSLPYRGANAGFEASAWFDAGAGVRSMAMVPLRSGRRARGLRAAGAGLAPTRYTAQMGIDSCRASAGGRHL